MRNFVCAVSEDAKFHDSIKGPFKSAGLNLINYTSMKEFLRSLDPEKLPNCVVGELKSSSELLRKLAENHCTSPVVLLASGNQLAAAVQAIKAGAFDVVDKADALADSAKKASTFASRNRDVIAEKAMAAERIDSLTRRESQVLALMVEGVPNREIAEKLEISPKTLDIHRANLMDKMEARTTADMCRAHLLHTTNVAHLGLIAKPQPPSGK